jgi:hypothetical protein
MVTANPLWGAPRIHGELQTLGVDVSERTVSRLIAPHARPRSQTWKTFLTNHLTSARPRKRQHLPPTRSNRAACPQRAQLVSSKRLDPDGSGHSSSAS